MIVSQDITDSPRIRKVHTTFINSGICHVWPCIVSFQGRLQCRAYKYRTQLLLTQTFTSEGIIIV